MLIFITFMGLLNEMLIFIPFVAVIILCGVNLRAPIGNKYIGIHILTELLLLCLQWRHAKS